jgi:hypothetical protein
LYAFSIISVIMRPTQRGADLGYAPRYFGLVLALGDFRLDGESTPPPQAATDNLQCQGFSGKLNH